MAADLIAQGRRSLVCGEIPQAVECLQKACEQLSSEYGELDERLGDPYLLYGSALLELARMESTVIGNALDGVPEDDSSSETSDNLADNEPEMTALEKEDLSNQVIDAMCEPPSVTDGPGQESGEPAENSPSEPEAESASEEEESHPGSEEVKDPSDPSKDEKSDTSDDEITNLQLAWEVIEVARKIFSAKSDGPSQLKVAECFEKLAEISREKENYLEAISDLQECLSIRTSVLPEDHRDIAETHFQLGTTHAVAGDLESASTEFKSTIRFLKMHSSNLESKVSEMEVHSGSNEELESIKKALQDVKSLIPDVECRLAEVEEDRLVGSSSTAPNETLNRHMTDQSGIVKPAVDITHLIRKKRCTDNVDETKHASKDSVPTDGVCSPEKKRSKLSNGSSGHVNGIANDPDVISEFRVLF
ncbi:unnamed protein product [Dicrocoelium dendriticum]|nr:unnamed protein product [Dicrocoelium dendriticum]